MAEIPDNLVQELNDLINNNIDAADFPYKKGNSIRIGCFAIRKKKSQYIIIDCKTNRIVQQVFSQPAAIALAKRLAKGKSMDQDIIRLDNRLMKHYVDCIFYSHTINKTKDEIKRETTRDRYDIARWEVEASTQALESHIFR